MGAAAEGQYVFNALFQSCKCFCIWHVQRLMALWDRKLMVRTVALGGGDVASSEGKADCCRMCAEWCLKANAPGPRPVCNSLSLECPLTLQTDVSVISGGWHPRWDPYKGDCFSKWSWLKSYQGWIQADCRTVSLQHDCGKQRLDIIALSHHVHS